MSMIMKLSFNVANGGFATTRALRAAASAAKQGALIGLGATVAAAKATKRSALRAKSDVVKGVTAARYQHCKCTWDLDVDYPDFEQNRFEPPTL